MFIGVTCGSDARKRLAIFRVTTHKLRFPQASFSCTLSISVNCYAFKGMLSRPSSRPKLPVCANRFHWSLLDPVGLHCSSGCVAGDLGEGGGVGHMCPLLCLSFVRWCVCLIWPLSVICYMVSRTVPSYEESRRAP